jgi:Amt family ammonium transporter
MSQPPAPGPSSRFPPSPTPRNGFAFGESNGRSNPFIGSGDFALSATNSYTRGSSSYYIYFFHWAFSAAAATITAGAVAERVAMGAYMGYTLLMTGFVYPVYTHWVWSQWGWLSPQL